MAGRLAETRFGVVHKGNEADLERCLDDIRKEGRKAGAIADIEALPLAALYKTFDKIGGGKTPYSEKYREALGDLETGPLQILSDPLNFLPTGLLGQGAKVLGQAASKLGKASDVKALAAAGAGAAKATEKLADIGKIARMPSRSADAAGARHRRSR